MNVAGGFVRDAVFGAAAGVLATLPMSAVMLAAGRAGLMGEQPPEVITKAALDAAGINLSEPVEHRIAIVDHLLFGAAAGALFGLGRRIVPGAAATLPNGMSYGICVWYSAYQGWVPALNIMPPADEDRHGRPESMLVAHLVFGAALAIAVQLLDRGRRGSAARR